MNFSKKTHRVSNIKRFSVITRLMVKHGLGDILDRFTCVEDMRLRFGWWAKLKAKAAAYGSWRSLSEAQPPVTAAILFTSGSESKPQITVWKSKLP